MNKTIFASLSVAFTLALAGVLFLDRRDQPQTELPVVEAARINWYPCDLLIYSETPLKCGHFYPGGDSGSFALPFVVFAYDGPDPQSDPLVYIAGGPGAGMQTESDRLQSWAYWVEEAGIKRDLIIFDQRGLKPGEPYRDCQPYNDLNRQLLADNLTLEQEYQLTLPVLHRCFREFDAWLRSPAVGVASGLKGFSSQIAARDLNKMLALLDYPHWNLWGVSYGTRLALVAAQQAPSKVRSMILDSPYPLNRGRLSEKPEIFAYALQRFWDVCENNEQLCGARVADPEALFWRVMARLAEHPETYRVRQSDGSHITMVLNDHRFLSLLFFALYDERLYPDIVRGLLLLDGEEQGSEPTGDPVQYLLNLFVSSVLDPGFNSLLFFATECNDNPLEAADIYVAAAAAHPLLQRFISLEEEYNPCKSSLFIADGLLDAQPAPTAPTLIVSGALDPVTPVTWAKTLARHLPGAQLVVVPQASHALIARGVCQPSVLSRFLHQPGAPIAISEVCL